MSEAKTAPIPTHVKPSIDKDGRKRPAHIAVRHKKVTFNEDVGHEDDGSPLDVFIAKHGGAEHLRQTLDDLTPDQRAKLIDAMAHVGGCTPADVMKQLDIHEPEASEDTSALETAKGQFQDRLADAMADGVITAEEYDTMMAVYEEEGLAVAIEVLRALRAPEPEPAKEALPTGTIERAPISEPDPAIAATIPSLEVAGSADINTQDQADALFQKHVDATNKGVRLRFEIEKRGIRKWKVPAQMLENAEQFEKEAAEALAEWRSFCETNGIPLLPDVD